MSALRAVLILALGLLLSCGSTDRTRLIVSVSGLDGVKALRVRATRDGVPAKGDMIISGHLQQFVVEVPADPGHMLDLVVTGLDDMPPLGCAVAGGSATGIVLSGQAALELSLGLGKLPPTCTLTLAPEGSGSVRIQVPGGTPASCTGPCSKDFPKGATLRLQPVPDARSYIDEGTEGVVTCDPQGLCSLPDVVLTTSLSRTIFRAKQCSADSWCAEAVPAGTRALLRGSWGTGGDDIWVVGFGGTVLHFNGVVWRSLNGMLPAASQAAGFQGVWGSGASDVWVVGGAGQVLRWNGTAWDTGPLLLLPGSASGIPLNAVWGSGPKDVWVAGDSGLILTWNGTAWIDRTPTDQPQVKNIRWTSVWGSGPTHVLLSGGQVGLIFVTALYDGTKVQPFLPDPGVVSIGLWGTGTDDMWSVGVPRVPAMPTFLHFDGTSWQTVPAPAGLPQSNYPSVIISPVAVSGSRRGEVWAVGGEVDAVAGQLSTSVDNGFIVHYQDTSFKSEALPGGRNNNLLHVWASPSGDVVAVGTSGTVLRRVPGYAWTTVLSGTDRPLRSIHGNGMAPGNVWVVGDGGTLLGMTSGKGAWTAQQHPGTESLLRVWQGTDGHAFAVGEKGVVQHWDQNSWTLDPFPFKVALTGVWAASSQDVLSVGQDGFLFRRGATGWSTLNNNLQDQLAGTSLSVWARTGPPATYFVATMNGLLLSGDRSGGDLSKTCDFAGQLAFSDVKGEDRAAGEVWVAGLRGTMLRVRDPGTGLSCERVPLYAAGNKLGGDLYGLWVTPGDSWTVGAGGTIQHWNGNAWAAVPGGTDRDLYAVWARSATDVWAVGDGGTILHYGPR